ncbi:ABC transporter transmembrane domain-containing protein, partial [Bacillus sp. WP8]|uniref:ABC transporter transmembrane domain-containing protein n=1 Tax=Bacillus sp. WP8 TaxID=756828 RepID=UPI00119E8A1D
MAPLLQLSFPLPITKLIHHLLPNPHSQPISFSPTFLLILYLITSTIHYLLTYFPHNLPINIHTHITNQLFSHLHTISFPFFHQNKTPNLLSPITNHLIHIPHIPHHPPHHLFIPIITLTPPFPLILSINSHLPLLTCILLAFLIRLSLYF